MTADIECLSLLVVFFIIFKTQQAAALKFKRTSSCIFIRSVKRRLCEFGFFYFIAIADPHLLCEYATTDDCNLRII